MSGYKKQIGIFAIRLLILLIICVFGLSAEAETNIYVFVPCQSAVVQTGGIAGFYETCGIDDIWWIFEGRDYPRLNWELIGD